jgi:hypothetical protein
VVSRFFCGKKGENGRTRLQDPGAKTISQRSCLLGLKLHLDANLCIAGLALAGNRFTIKSQSYSGSVFIAGGRTADASPLNPVYIYEIRTLIA